MHSIMGIGFNCCYNNANALTLSWMSMQRPAERILCKKKKNNDHKNLSSLSEAFPASCRPFMFPFHDNFIYLFIYLNLSSMNG